MCDMSDEMKSKMRIVKETLKLLHILSYDCYSESNYRASVIFMDLKEAITDARLTSRQLDAITYVYVDDNTRSVASERLGVSRKTLDKIETTAIEEIAKYYRGGLGNDNER